MSRTKYPPSNRYRRKMTESPVIEPWRDITKELPQIIDGDAFGKVRVRCNSSYVSVETRELCWEETEIEVSEIDPRKHSNWKHTDNWHTDHEPYTRTATQIAVNEDYLVVLASDGTFWKTRLNRGPFRKEWEPVVGNLPQGYKLKGS